MTRSNSNPNISIQNSYLSKFAAEINANLIVDKKIQCPIEQSHVHTKINRGLFEVCLGKATWFGIPYVATEGKRELKKHGIRVIRGKLKNEHLEKLNKFNLKDSQNLFIFLPEMLNSPWSKIKKSSRKIRNAGFEIQEISLSEASSENEYSGELGSSQKSSRLIQNILGCIEHPVDKA